MSQMDTIGKFFLNRCKKSAKDNSFGWIENREIKFATYEDYKNIVERLSLALIQHGLKPGDKVSILGATSKEWHLSDMAILCSRGVTIPIYPSYTAGEVKFIFNHSESSILFVENDLQMQKCLEVLSELENLKLIVSFQELGESTCRQIPENIDVISFKELQSQGVKAVKENPELFESTINTQTGDEIASIIYTSGTTGVPKGAVIRHHAFAAMLRNVDVTMKGAFRSNDRTLTFLPLSHVLGRCDSFMPLIFGWEMVFARSIDTLVHDIELTCPTVMIAVPRIFEKIYAKVMEQIREGSFVKQKIFKWAQSASLRYFEKLQEDKSPSTIEILERQLAYRLVYSKIYEKFGGRIRYFVSGGAPLSADIIKFLRNANLTILEGYGLTETIAPCPVNPLSKQIPGTVGIPIGDVQIKFASDGEILIKTEALFSEYYKNEEETNKTLEDGWFHSGDIGEFTPQGYLKITDRKKDIIITAGGKNVAPQKIENMAKTKPHISHFVVIGDNRKYLTAIVGIEKEKFLNDLDKLELPSDCKVKDLAKNKQVQEMVDSEVKEINSQLAQYETIKKFYISPHEFTIEDGHLTPSLKIKRKVVYEKYKDQINAMYPRS